MLQIVTFPLDEVALVAVPTTGAVAVVDAAARSILEGLCDGRDEEELATGLTRTRGVAPADAREQVAELRRVWTGLAKARPLARRPATAGTPACPPALDAVCRLGPVPVRLRIWPPRLATLVAAVTVDCRCDGRGEHESRTMPALAAWRAGGRYLLSRDGSPLLTTDSLMIARSELLRCLVLASHPGRQWMAVLHGAGVAGPHGAALLCGSSGAGKSTLTGFLIASGLDLVTDDYAPLESGTHHLWPVPFGLSVKEGSWPLLAPHFPGLAAMPVVRSRLRRQRYLRPPRVSGEPQAVRCLVFPLYRPGAGVELIPLQPGEALELCAHSGGWYESSRERLSEFTQWLTRTPSYALAYDDAAGAVAAVRKLISC